MTLRSSSGQEVSHGDPRCDKQSTKTLESSLTFRVSSSRQMRPRVRMKNDREFVLRVILLDTMLGWAQTENDIFNLWVMMIMLLCY